MTIALPHRFSGAYVLNLAVPTDFPVLLNRKFHQEKVESHSRGVLVGLSPVFRRRSGPNGLLQRAPLQVMLAPRDDKAFRSPKLLKFT